MTSADGSPSDAGDLPLIGRGRAADVFDLGNGRVLRRYRTPHPGIVEREATAMQHLRAHGAPVPEVFEASGEDMVMERLTGISMLDAMKSRPWRARAIGRQLASLQRVVHAIPAGDVALPRFSDGDAILHFDLHPDNVMLTDDGPVIIDWSNVAVGAPMADVVFSWMVMCTSSPDNVPAIIRPILQRVRNALTDGFIEGTPVDDEARRWIARACERRLVDPNLRDDERVRVRAFAAQHAPEA